MANKKTVVEMYDVVKAMLNGEQVEDCTLEQALAFIDKRIEITQKKNASGKSGELTPKQKEALAARNAVADSIVAVMESGTKYTPTELVKALGNEDIKSTQKITPYLTTLVVDGKLVKVNEKGRNLYILPVAVTPIAED